MYSDQPWVPYYVCLISQASKSTWNLAHLSIWYVLEVFQKVSQKRKESEQILDVSIVTSSAGMYFKIPRIGGFPVLLLRCHLFIQPHKSWDLVLYSQSPRDKSTSISSSSHYDSCLPPCSSFLRAWGMLYSPPYFSQVSVVDTPEGIENPGGSQQAILIQSQQLFLEWSMFNSVHIWVT